MAQQRFHQTGILTRFIIKRDRLRLPIWLIALLITSLATAWSFTDLYQNEQERQSIAQTMINPATTAMIGPGHGLDNYTFGAMMAHQMLGMTALVVGIMSILLVVRHTRAQEEDGRLELVHSLPTGSLANLSATLIVVVGLNILLALATGFGLASLSIESMDLEGSLMYGAGLGAVGIFFAALTTCLAQLTESSRGAIGLAIAMLIGAYLIRAIGDVSNETLSMFSPFGWIQATEVYVNDIWWPLLLPLVAAFIFTALAFQLNVKRDVEAGLLPTRAGRSRASFLLQSVPGLVFRLQRTSLIFWGIGMLILGATYGSVLGETEVFIEDVEMMQEFISAEAGLSLTEQFLAMLMSVIAIASTIPALISILRLKGEEKRNRLEQLLAHPVSQPKLYGTYVLMALLTGTIMLTLATLGLGGTAVATIDNEIEFFTFMEAGLVYLPAMWVMVGVTALLLGFMPKAASVIWFYLLYSFVVVYMGGMFQFPEWMEFVSPFGNIPELPIDEFNVWSVALLSGLALLLVIVGGMAYRRRDIEG